jgi:hypothetical protein
MKDWQYKIQIKRTSELDFRNLKVFCGKQARLGGRTFGAISLMCRALPSPINLYSFGISVGNLLIISDVWAKSYHLSSTTP